jgi:hypothetical protein
MGGAGAGAGDDGGGACWGGGRRPFNELSIMSWICAGVGVVDGEGVTGAGTACRFIALSIMV